MTDDRSGLCVSVVMKQFNEFLDEFDKPASPVTCGTSETTPPCGSSVEDSVKSDSIADKEWQKFLQNGLGKPDNHGNTTDQANDGNHGNNQLTNDMNQSQTKKDVYEKLTKRSRESILVSEAFDFLPSYEGINNTSNVSTYINKGNNMTTQVTPNMGNNMTTQVTPGEQSLLELNNDVCDTSDDMNSQTCSLDGDIAEGTVEDPVESGSPAENTVLKQSPVDTTSILRNKLINEQTIEHDQRLVSEQTIEHDQRLVSEAFQFIKELDTGTDAPSCDDIRETRVISAAFQFLAAEESSLNVERMDKNLSTVDEDASETDASMTDAILPTAGAEIPAPPNVIMRRESSQSHRPGSQPASSSDQSQLSDSEDDDDEVHVMPGAWRNSKFAYVGDVSDTASESSSTSSPQSSPAIKRNNLSPSRPKSMYPPSKSKQSESKVLCVTSQGTSTIGSATELIGRMDSIESMGHSGEDDESILNGEVFEKATQNPATNIKDRMKGKKSRYSHQRQDSTSTTISEKEYRANYRSLKRTRILRDATLSKADYVLKPTVHEVSYEVTIEMQQGESEFGYHIWGNNPVIVSTVNDGSSADRAGIQPGNILVTVNKINISKMSTQEIVQITVQGGRRVILGVADENRLSDIPLCCGHLSKQGGNFFIKKWRTRWVELKNDHCLYYYKDKGDVDPLGAVPVFNYTVTKAPEVNNDLAFKLTKYNAKTYYFSAQSETEMANWADAISRAAQSRNKADTWLDISSHNVSLPTLAIRHPDCHGYLNKLGNGRKSWRRRYCVLKDACLYYYLDINSSTAKGVAHFHGYSVEGAIPFKKNFGFMLLPPEPDMRTFYFYADNETEQKRWLTSFQDSISKWIRIDE